MFIHFSLKKAKQSSTVRVRDRVMGQEEVEVRATSSKMTLPSLGMNRFLDRAPSGSVFISLCFIVRSVDAMGFAAAFTSSTALASKVFPHNVATILVGLACPDGTGMWWRYVVGHGEN